MKLLHTYIKYSLLETHWQDAVVQDWASELRPKSPDFPICIVVLNV